MPSDPNLSLQHLHAELARIDLLIQREVRRWQLAGQDPNDGFRGLKISDQEAQALAARPFAHSWGQTVQLDSRDEAALAAAMAALDQEVASLAQQARQGRQKLRLQHLAQAFGLDRFDLDAFLICLAPHLDLRYERVYGYLQDDVTRRRPTVNLVLDLLGAPGPERLQWLARFADDAPLFRHVLLERVAEAGPAQPALLGQALAPDDAVVAWLLGGYQPHAELGRHASLLPPQARPGDQVLAGEQGPAALASLQAAAALPPVLVLAGPDHASHDAVMRLVAAETRRAVLAVDLAALAGSDWSPLRVVRLALRDARLTGALPYLKGWEVCLAGEAAGRLPDLMAEISAHPDLVVIASRHPWQAPGFERSRHRFSLDFPTPAYAQRLAVWEHALRAAGLPLPPTLPALAGQFSLTAGQILDAVAAAADRAAQRGEPAGEAHLFAAARAHSSPGLANLAHKIEARYGWNDIVLPDDQISMLREIIATVRGRPTVLETWGLGRKLASSAGVTVLFAGPPGTGKTMAAEVIASELGLDLYKIDLSTVVNKYIGETEKNLGRIFDEAASSNAILFFDEADAIFGKRSEVKDAHDRYANIEVSYLLQRMEAYDGITVLATNLRANLDDAFTRRLSFAVDFPFPDEAYRLRIWQALFPPELPRADDLDLPLLARRFKLAGGNIRNIIISAAYLAAADGGRVGMPHLLHGARRELQKMGRLIKEKEMTYG